MKTQINNNNNHHDESPGLTLGDIYFILFRHKRKIILLSLLGIAAAAAYYTFNPPPFQSEAKLFIRYVLDNRSFNPTANNNTRVMSPDEMGQSIINSEIQILTSFDLAEEVATNIGPEKILAPFSGGDNPVKAAEVIQKNLAVNAPKQSSVIDITFHHPDPTIVQPVLQGIIADYLDKHLQVHRAMGTSDDFLTEETAQLRSQIGQTENELRSIKTNAGIISVTDAEKSYTEQIALTREALFQTQAELAEREVVPKPDAANAAPAPSPAPDQVTVPSSQVNDYQNIYSHLEYLQKRLDNYLTVQGYTEQNELVKEVRGQIAEAMKLKNNLEQKYPALADLYLSSPGTPGQPASPSPNGIESIRALQSKIAVLKSQLNQLQAEAANVDAAESKIADLQQKKQMQENDYQYFETSLEQARIDEALGPGRVSNISAIQTPTPPFKDRSVKFKAMAMMILGGIFGGVAWAFLIELYFDTSVKRSHEIETKLKLPLFLTIPDISRNGQRHLAQAAERRLLEARQAQTIEAYNANGEVETEENDRVEIISWETSGFLNPFYDALRDRLIHYFESIDLMRKPKLVAVTGTERGSGVSTIASGLAAAFSETGDGRVLLVDMNLENGAAQQFFRGRPGCCLDDALELETREYALVQENLYVVAESSDSEKLQRILPKRFASLLPKLKASDYDYIIFDMPPVSQTSVTARLAGFMDMMLLVIQSEKTGRDAVREAATLLDKSNVKIGVVFNKARKYVPNRLH
ncbi:MAG: GumC family protein, partial [Limisphaerales bacterium]